MDINAIVNTVAKMFPNAKVTEAVQQAEQMIQGTGNDLESVRATAGKIGLNSNFVNSMYRKYANTPAAKMLCNLLGTTPDNIKDDAMNIVGGWNSTRPASNSKPKNTPKFPRLK